MAAESERLIAQRTALLARVQAARESRRRSEMLEAREEREAAVAARDKQDQAVVEAAQNRIDQLRARYDAMATNSVGGADIQALRQLEEALAREQQKQEGRLADAEAAILTADAKVEEAMQAYTAEAMRSRKRDKLAERTQQTYRRVLFGEEESVVEEELGDRLASSTTTRW